MERVIQNKWKGKFDINSSIYHYSLSYNLYVDKHRLYTSDRIFSEIWFYIKTFDLSDKTHQYKFHVWKDSMMLRAQIEMIVIFVFTSIFQVFLIRYSKNM